MNSSFGTRSSTQTSPQKQTSYNTSLPKISLKQHTRKPWRDPVCACVCICMYMHVSWHVLELASFPGPSPEERPGTHCLRMHIIKSFAHFLVRMRKIILTKNTEVSLNYIIYSSDDLTCSTLLGYQYTFQTWQYYFSKRTVQEKGNKSIYQKGPLVATEYLSRFVHGL